MQPAALSATVTFYVLLACSWGRVCWSWSDAIDAARQRILIHEVYRDDAGEHRFAISLPSGFSADQKWPVLLFLHGAGEKGTDGQRQLTVGLGAMLRHMPDFPFVVVLPQCEDVDGRYLTGWLAQAADGRRALRILEQVERSYPVDSSRRVLCGWSMGGFGAWSIAAAEPNRWSAVLALAGGGDPSTLPELAKSRVPVWAIHGADDVLIPSSRSEEMVHALDQMGGRGTCTVLPGVDHDVWRPVFLNPRVTDWLLQPESVATEELDWVPVLEAAAELPEYDADFRADVVIRQGLGIRLGNDALAAWAQGAPRAIPAEALTGDLQDITREFGEGADHVSATLAGDRFTCRVSECRIQALSGGWLRVEFGLSPLRLMFKGTTLTGPAVAARTGPFEIVLGHRNPARLILDLRPAVKGDQVELVPLTHDFQLGAENWYVSRPNEIEVTRGDFLPQHITTGIVGGLSLNRDAIVAQVREVVPGLLKSIETRLNSLNGGRMVSRLLWPLPFLAPRLRLRASEIRTDDQGVNVLLDLEVARQDLLTDTPPRKPAVTPVTFSNLGRSQDFSLWASLEVVQKLSETVVSQGMLRVNVLDTPTPELQLLADPQVLRTWLPRIPANADDLRSVIALDEGFRLTVKQGSESSAQLQLLATGLTLGIQRRLEPDRWQEIAKLTLSLEQALNVGLNSDAEPIALAIEWQPEARWTLTASSPADLSPEAAQALQKLLEQGWQAWIADQPHQEFKVPELEIGGAALRWSGMDWRRSTGNPPADQLQVRYSAPISRIVNHSDRLALFERRAADGEWSLPQIVQPGATAEIPGGPEREFRLLHTPSAVLPLPPGGSLSIGANGKVQTVLRGANGQ